MRPGDSAALTFVSAAIKSASTSDTKFRDRRKNHGPLTAATSEKETQCPKNL